MGLSIKPVHEYCSKCGALKVNKNAEVCQTASVEMCLVMKKAQNHFLLQKTKKHNEKYS